MENKYKIVIKNIYEGPMELLLDLIKKNKIDIYDIPISDLTDEFIQSLGEINYTNLESFLDFSLMAASLLQIKSRMLLPKIDEAEEEEDPRAELIERIIEYNYYKTVADSLNNYFSIGNSKLLKRTEDLTILAMEENIDYREMDSTKLLKTISKMLAKKVEKYEETVFDIEHEKFTMEESLERLKELLLNKDTLLFSSLFNSKASKVEIITFFLAILELIKSNKIIAKQEKDNDIIIEKVLWKIK